MEPANTYDQGELTQPSGDGMEPPNDGHLDGYATGWGGGFMAFFAVLLWDVDSPQGGGTPTGRDPT